MVKVRYVVLVIAIVVAGYYAATELGFIGSGFDKVKKVDAEFGISSEQLVPANAQSLKEYKEKLLEIEGKTPEETALLQEKISLIQMQEAMLSLSENLRKIDFYSLDCSPNGSILSAKKDSEDALAKANEAIMQSERIGNADGFEYMTGETFSENMALVMKSLISTTTILDQAC